MTSLRRFLAAAALAGVTVTASSPIPADAQVGQASWYALTSITASGERADPNGWTAAHRTLPLGTRVLVKNIANGRTVIVRINDRGPFVGKRIIDVTKAVADYLGFVNQGLAWVELKTLPY